MLRMLSLCFCFLLFVMGSLPLYVGCGGTQCTGEYSSLDVSTHGRPCQKDCDCNNQKSEGYCAADYTCVSVDRVPCSDEPVGGERNCTIHTKIQQYAKGKCTQRIQLCQEKGLLSKMWGNCRCPRPNQPDGKEPQTDASDQPETIIEESSNQDQNSTPDRSTPPEKRTGEEVTPDKAPEKETGEEVTPEKDLDKEATPEPDNEPKESLPEAECTAGQTRPCSTKQGCTQSSPGKYECKGVCKVGEETCQNGKWSGTCDKEVGPTKETCDGKDNNCDGKIDNIVQLGQACTAAGQQGPCQDGKWTCSNNQQVCQPNTQPVVEVCGNQKDDNCNGLTDETCAATWPIAGNGLDSGADVAVDAQGNVYATGWFEGTMTLGTTTLKSNGDKDLFVVKFDAQGRVQWAVSEGGKGIDRGMALAVDTTGNVYLTGQFSDTFAMGSTTVSSKGGIDLYVVKLDPKGAIQWVQTAGSSQSDAGNDLVLGPKGNVYITGIYNNSIALGTYTLSSQGARDAFVAALDSSGKVLWAQTGGGVNREDPLSIAVDSSGNLYAVGFFNGTANFGSTTITAKANNDLFVVKLDNKGNTVWSQSLQKTGTSETRIWAQVDSHNDVVLAGSFSGTIFTGPHKLLSIDSDDIFAAKLSPTGELRWTKNFAGSLVQTPEDLALDRAGNLYLTGYFQGTFFFGTTTLQSTNTQDTFVAKVSANGCPQWAASPKAAGRNYSYGITVANGVPYLTGFFEKSIVFQNTTFSSKGNLDAYVAKWLPDRTLPQDSGDLTLVRTTGQKGSNLQEGGWKVKTTGKGKATYSDTQVLQGKLALSLQGGTTDTDSVQVSTSFVAQKRVVFQADVYIPEEVTCSGGVDVGLFEKGPTGTGNYVLFGYRNPAQKGKWMYQANDGKSGPIVGCSSITFKQWNRVEVLFDNGHIQLWVNGKKSCSTNVSWKQVSSVWLRTEGCKAASYWDNLAISPANVCTWSAAGGGTKGDESYAAATDSQGNIYITGYFHGTAVFWTTTLTSLGGTDIFVAKLSPQGTFLWAKRAGSAQASDGGSGIATDPQGNVYITGRFDGSSDFGTFKLTGSANGDIFIAKMNPKGQFLWAKKVGRNSTDSGNDIAIGPQGNVYVTGVYTNNSDKTGVPFGSTTLKSANSTNAFVAKLQQDGTWVWAVSPNSSLSSSGLSLVAPKDGFVYVTGRFTGVATFGTTTLTSRGKGDIYVAQLDKPGNWTWATRAGSTEMDAGAGITAGPQGNLYVTGLFKSTASFGTHSLTSQGLEDAFIGKLNNQGAWQWVKQVRSVGEERSNQIVASANGNIYVAGSFHSTGTFGTLAFSSQGSDDIFLAIVDTNGNWVGAKQAGGKMKDVGWGLAIDANQNPIVVGSFGGTANFGGRNQSAKGEVDVFIWKIAP